MKKIILASKSPRRKELLSLLKLPFDIIEANIIETIDYDNDLVKEIEKLSYQKAAKVFSEHSDAIVIGSDTIVKINNKVLGKPKSYEEAEEMLHMLSGNIHEVVTAVSILVDDKIDTFSSITEVEFFPLSDEEIETYISTNEPMDKAGAYAIQGDGAKFIKKINGDFYTVVGLPVSLLYNHLKPFLND